MKWVETTGGPMLCILDRYAELWQGMQGSSLKSATGTDYERACKVGDYIGVLQSDFGVALILGDMPMPTAILESDETCPIIIRIMYGNTSEFSHSEINTALDCATSIESITFHTEIGKMTVFDSSARLPIPAGDLILFDVKDANYTIETFDVLVGEENRLIVHRWESQ